jgi:hypothetical protein
MSEPEALIAVAAPAGVPAAWSALEAAEPILREVRAGQDGVDVGRDGGRGYEGGSWGGGTGCAGEGERAGRVLCDHSAPCARTPRRD